MNPISKLLKLPAEATVGEARKLVAEQVMSSMSSHPGREALLSALECGPYERKFGKRRGKTLTMLDEHLLLSEHHAMILAEAQRELCSSLHELVQDELEARPRYRLEGERPVLVSFETPGSLPPEWQPDPVALFRITETNLRKHAHELVLTANLLAYDQLSPAQLAILATAPVEAPENDGDPDVDDEDED